MQRVFITGASSGIGAALALFYARRGAQVALVGRRETALREVLRSLPAPHARVRQDETAQADEAARQESDTGLGQPAIAPSDDHGHRLYVADVCDRPALHRAAADFLQGGPVDIVIASAGISVGTLTEELDDFEVFGAVMATNVNGTVATFEPFIADMKRRGGGTLVGIASVAGVRGLPGAGAYSASKAAVRCYCESLRVELRQAGIRVVTIAPGFIQTPMTARNPYKMPFLMPVDRFAAAAGRAIDRASSYTVIPWQMGIVARLLRIVPNALYDRVAAGRKRKPRREPG
jgi:NAD(P)-dependent dehydrogenase (short-subunit alcohol dehydrogenase family)